MSAPQRVAERDFQGFDSRRLETVFNRCFREAYSTLLLGGAEEPFYRPASDPRDCHELHYREDFFASALHEVAHWCIAGSERRKLADFGYWYAPDSRDAAQQLAFERVEGRPQALEWFFSKACGFRFQVSLDNFNQDVDSTGDSFSQHVYAEACRWQVSGLPDRAQLFFLALCEEFGTAPTFNSLSFSLAELG